MISATTKYRDVLLVPHGKTFFITGCDSCGGIGMKVNDSLEAPPEIVGMMTTRVAVLEVISLGAQIVGVAVPISNEPDETGSRILSGVEDCLRAFKIDAQILTSMEKNMVTSMTAVGVVVNGVTSEVRAGAFENGDGIYVVGRPSVGAEVLEYEKDLFDAKAAQTLLFNEDVREILPVGSMGILEELTMMTASHDVAFELDADLAVDVRKSCGPSTAAIVIVKKEGDLDLDLPLFRIGYIKC